MDSIGALPSFLFDNTAENSTLSSNSSSSASSGSPPTMTSLLQGPLADSKPSRPSWLFGSQALYSSPSLSSPTDALSSILDPFDSPLNIQNLTGTPLQHMTNRLSSANRGGRGLNSADVTSSPLGAPGTPINGLSSPMCVSGVSPPSNGNVKNPKLYKTELCRSWMEHGRCNYGERCQYAHGEIEKRAIPRHPKYKTEACQSFHQTGYCPYGPRCHFIHSESEHLSQLASANAFSSLFSAPARSASANGGSMGGPGGPAMTPGTHSLHHHHHSTNSAPNALHRMCSAPSYGSAGESPAGSSADSGSESPNGSFSPPLDDDFGGPFTVGFMTPQTAQRRPVQRFNSAYEQKTSEPISGLLNDLMAFKFDDKWSDDVTSRLPVFAQLSANQ